MIGPWGPIAFDPDLPRKACARDGCFIRIAYSKASGLCYGCELDALCRFWMPTAGERCARRFGHVGNHRTRWAMDHETATFRGYLCRKGR